MEEFSFFNLTPNSSSSATTCDQDTFVLIFLVAVNVLMAIGNGLLLTALIRVGCYSRTDILIINQLLVDSLYTCLYPLVIMDASRKIVDQRHFVAFKIVEDSLITLSVLAVIGVNWNKYLNVRSKTPGNSTVSHKFLISGSVVAWVLTPIGFAVRNSTFDCRRNDPCGPSYLYCLAANGYGEISSVIFYCLASLIILGLNCRLIHIAYQFRRSSHFRRDSDLGRKNFCGVKSAQRRRLFKIFGFPLATNAAMLVTIAPFWINMALCQIFRICLDSNHSLFYLVRLHSLINPYCTLMTHRRYTEELRKLRPQQFLYSTS